MRLALLLCIALVGCRADYKGYPCTAGHFEPNDFERTGVLIGGPFYFEDGVQIARPFSFVVDAEICLGPHVKYAIDVADSSTSSYVVGNYLLGQCDLKLPLGDLSCSSAR